MTTFPHLQLPVHFFSQWTVLTINTLTVNFVPRALVCSLPHRSQTDLRCPFVGLEALIRKQPAVTLMNVKVRPNGSRAMDPRTHRSETCRSLTPLSEAPGWCAGHRLRFSDNQSYTPSGCSTRFPGCTWTSFKDSQGHHYGSFY